MNRELFQEAANPPCRMTLHVSEHLMFCHYLGQGSLKQLGSAPFPRAEMASLAWGGGMPPARLLPGNLEECLKE